MSSQGSQPDESEREQIQDDIERLQLALQEDDEYESESDDGNHLQIDPDYEPEYDGIYYNNVRICVLKCGCI